MAGGCAGDRVRDARRHGRAPLHARPARAPRGVRADRRSGAAVVVGRPAADALLAEAEVLVGHWGCPTLTAEVLDRAPALRLFAYGAGTVKWQVTDAVFERGIVVTSAAAANAVPVAEYTVAMILLANKGVFLVRERQRDPDARVAARPRPCRATAGPGSGIVGRVARRPPRDRAAARHRPRARGLRPVPLGDGGRRSSAWRRSTTSTSCARRCDSSRSTRRTSRRRAG